MKLFTNKFFISGFLFLLLLSIPLTLFFVSKQQEIRSRATPSTTLSFNPANVTATLNEPFTVDVNVDPGQNVVSSVKLVINYDTTKLEVTSADVTPSTSFGLTLEGPTITSGTILISLGIGFDVSRAVQSPTKVVSIKFKPIAPTGGTPSQITINATQTEILSLASGDQPGENVYMKNAAPATVTINQGDSPTTAPSPTEATSAPSPTTPAATAGENMPPTCSALNVDRETSGTAPFSMTFTANGKDTDGKITKVTFDFGDGPVQDITEAGNIGSNSVSVQVAHTYRSPGTYKVSATLTDDKNAISTVETCTQTITVTKAEDGGTGGVGPTSTPAAATETPAPTPAATDTPAPTLTLVATIPDTGSTETTIAVVGAVVLTVIGGLLLLAL
ncbi:PKD domain-containing protein [Candidatus Parcubacteria bacterium]|nr:MAG: PKD domain-containing protein [Candidatus Parcubacteria bacterium]